MFPPRGSRRASDEVYRILHGRIVTGELAPGTRIDVDALASELDVSRTPVREAILQLASAGLVERQAYRGTVVTGVNEARLEEVTALRISIEGLAAELGALRLTDDDIERMATIQGQIEKMGEGPEFSFGTFNDLNRAFHDVVYRAADAPVLSRLIDILGAEADRIRLHFQLTPTLANEFHRAIVDACRKRDAAGARDATRRHLLEAYFEMRGDRQIPPGPLAVTLAECGMTTARQDRA
jgi:DNA-binding GntR family transcriptional regulator